MKIHKEGTASIIIATCVALILGFLGYFLNEYSIISNLLYGLAFFIFIIVLQFFRVPKRIVSLNDNHVIAPADGKVVVIEEVEEPEYFKDKRLQVSIFMSPLNVHANWFPVSGKVKYSKYHPGKYLVAWHPKSSTENERTTVVVESSKGTSILFRQIAGALAKRIVNYAKKDNNCIQGEEFGFIKFGSRIDLFLPIGTQIDVKLNEKVTGKKTIIAKI